MAAAGNLTTDGVWAFTYDAENRLTGASKSGTSVTYSYDGLGRRISKTVNSVTTEYLLDGDETIAEYDGSTLLRRYVYGPSIDDRVLMYEGSGTGNKQYYIADHRGSTLALTDGGGSVVDTFAYSPFGESDTLTGNPYRYTGRRLDAETGLYYYRARYYSAALGRFLQTDPIGYEDQMNLYAYVGNDPVNMVDPSGQCGTKEENYQDCTVNVAEGLSEEQQEQADGFKKEILTIAGSIAEGGSEADIEAWEKIDSFSIDPENEGPNTGLGNPAAAQADIRNGKIEIFKGGVESPNAFESRFLIVHEVTHFKEPFFSQGVTLAQERIRRSAQERLGYERRVDESAFVAVRRLQYQGKRLVPRTYDLRYRYPKQ